MARPKLIEINGRAYRLDKGVTAAELEEQLELWLTVHRFPLSDSDAPNAHYYVFHNFQFVPRNSFKRKHYKPRVREVRLDRPRFGPGSGRAGGGRTGAHYRDHTKHWPGTMPETCPVCQRGLPAVLAQQYDESMAPASDQYELDFPPQPYCGPWPDDATVVT